MPCSTLNPLYALDALVSSEANESLLAQIDYLEREIANLKTEDQRLTKAYFAGAFNEDEYAEMRSDIKKRESTAKKSILTLEFQIITPEIHRSAEVCHSSGCC